ncbi:MAG: AraC family transcriptional regulator ligand-binding domain-containing protein [bacterium]
MTSQQLQRLETRISGMTGDSRPGLNVDEALRWANVGIVGHIVVNSRNVIGGLKRFSAYYQIVSNINILKMVARLQQIELCWQVIDNPLLSHFRMILEGILACLKPLLAEQTGKTVSPKEIQFDIALLSTAAIFAHSLTTSHASAASHASATAHTQASTLTAHTSTNGF